MNDLRLIYPPMQKMAADFKAKCLAAEIPVIEFSTLRTPDENAKIYPNNPTRWSWHLVGLAIDWYPAEYKTWPAVKFRTNFNNWKNWPLFRKISVECGFDPAQAFNSADLDHVQCMFACASDVIKAEYLNFKGTNDQKLVNAWHYIDTHRKAA